VVPLCFLAEIGVAVVVKLVATDPQSSFAPFAPLVKVTSFVLDPECPNGLKWSEKIFRTLTLEKSVKYSSVSHWSNKRQTNEKIKEIKKIFEAQTHNKWIFDRNC